MPGKCTACAVVQESRIIVIYVQKSAVVKGSLLFCVIEISRMFLVRFELLVEIPPWLTEALLESTFTDFSYSIDATDKGEVVDVAT